MDFIGLYFLLQFHALQVLFWTDRIICSVPMPKLKESKFEQTKVEIEITKEKKID